MKEVNAKTYTREELEDTKKCSMFSQNSPRMNSVRWP